MATNLAVGMLLRIRTVCYSPSETQLGECVQHWQVGTPVGVVTDQDVADALSQRFAPAFRAWIGDNCSYRGVGVQIIKPVAFPEVFNNAFAGVGTSGGVAQPLQVTALVRHQSSVLYVGPGIKHLLRRAQGRSYVPFPSVTWVGNPDPMSAGGFAALTGVATAIGLNRTIVGHGGNVGLTIGTYVTTDYGPPKVQLFIPSDNLFPVRLWATQRRRGEYGRQNVDPFA